MKCQSVASEQKSQRWGGGHKRVAGRRFCIAYLSKGSQLPCYEEAQETTENFKNEVSHQWPASVAGHVPSAQKQVPLPLANPEPLG